MWQYISAYVQVTLILLHTGPKASKNNDADNSDMPKKVIKLFFKWKGESSQLNEEKTLYAEVAKTYDKNETSICAKLWRKKILC